MRRPISRGGDCIDGRSFSETQMELHVDIRLCRRLGIRLRLLSRCDSARAENENGQVHENRSRYQQVAHARRKATSVGRIAIGQLASLDHLSMQNRVASVLGSAKDVSEQNGSLVSARTSSRILGFARERNSASEKATIGEE